MSQSQPEDGDGDEDRTAIGVAGAPSSGRRDRAHLIVLAGPGLGQMYRIDGPEVVIGRGADANIRLNDDGVSRLHARIYLANDGQLCIEDLESANGTLLNEHRVRRAVLRDGDKIQVGSTTVLKFTYADELEESFQQKMHETAVRDGLTGAFNKGHFLQRLQTEAAYAKRHKVPLSLLMMDVDHFKKINDSFGHPAGDFVLASLGQIVQGTIRAEDLLARFGGEEFAVLCRGVSANRALVLAERIRSMVEGFRFEHHSRRLRVTVSIGVASWFDQPDSATQLVADADDALYKAKNSGRNRVVVRAFRGT
jgi:diguanylate cyclase (GGDEF)-like protein